MLVRSKSFWALIFWAPPSPSGLKQDYHVDLIFQGHSCLLIPFKSPHSLWFCLFIWLVGCLCHAAGEREILIFWGDWIMSAICIPIITSYIPLGIWWRLWTSYPDKCMHKYTQRFNHNFAFILEEIHWTPAVYLCILGEKHLSEWISKIVPLSVIHFFTHSAYMEPLGSNPHARYWDYKGK